MVSCKLDGSHHLLERIGIFHAPHDVYHFAYKTPYMGYPQIQGISLWRIGFPGVKPTQKKSRRRQQIKDYKYRKSREVCGTKTGLLHWLLYDIHPITKTDQSDSWWGDDRVS